MVTMLVGDKDPVKALRIDRQERQPSLYLFGGETAVDQNPDFCRLQ
jgi:hypothetical protein